MRIVTQTEVPIHARSGEFPFSSSITALCIVLHETRKAQDFIRVPRLGIENIKIKVLRKREKNQLRMKKLYEHLKI